MKAVAAEALAVADLAYRNSSKQLAKATNANRPLAGERPVVVTVTPPGASPQVRPVPATVTPQPPAQ